MSEKPQNLPDLNRAEQQKPSPFSSESVNTKIAKAGKSPDIAKMVKDRVDPKGELAKKGGDKLKTILEGKENSPEKVKNDIVDRGFRRKILNPL
ncbi:MAG: hypothetical protein Q9M97_10285 [Candidatus Gracilibacteria bacterium]|nr:hypothetical protein [Candidatus Gracilibacteria bacterium]